MRRRGSFLALLLASASLAACSAGADDPSLSVDDPPLIADDLDASADAELWFVELAEPPLARGGDHALLRAEKARFRQRALAARLRLHERRAFDRLWNGLSLKVAAADVADLARLPGVRAVYPVVPITLDDAAPDSNSQPDLANALAMTGADVTHTALGITGEGVKVGVIDTGVDYDHPDLGGCFGPGCRVATGWDFVGDGFDANAAGVVPAPDANPDDCAGHGTHVAGIIGAKGKITGVAPGVTFGAYRVFGCSGSTSSDVMIAAMERAFEDGMRVVNMSIGAAFQWPEYPSAKAANELAKSGVVVVASIGNSGASGLYAAGAPGLGERVIGTASFDNQAISVPAFSVTPDDAAIGYDVATASPPAPTTGTSPLARTGTPDALDDACAALPPGSLAGATALIRRGTCTFYEKTKNAEAAGAIAVVIYNNSPGSFGATVAAPMGSPAVKIPVLTIAGTDGALLDGRVAAGPVAIAWSGATVSKPNPSGGRISAFSSYGLSPDLAMKPDLGAPGGSIHSTYPLELGGYDTLSGTSMASPHVAGAAALLLEGRPKTEADEVLGLLQNTAIPAASVVDFGGLVPEGVHRQGAGMIHVDAAITTKATITPSRIALGESAAGPSTTQLTLRNSGPEKTSWKLSHLAAASSSGPTNKPLGVAPGATAVQFSAPSLDVPPGGEATVDVTITADPALADHALFGGYLVFAADDGAALRVPYVGFKGDYQSIQILAPTDKGYPWLVKRVGAVYENQPSGAVYTFQNGDVPTLFVHFEHHARRVRVDVFDALKMKPWGTAFDFDLVGRSGSAGAATTYSWNGLTVMGKDVQKVPNGTYVLRLSALKALGDEANPADWETWTSPPLTINRP